MAAAAFWAKARSSGLSYWLWTAPPCTSLGNCKALGLTPNATYTNSCVQVQLQATVDQSQRMTLGLATRASKSQELCS